MIFEESKIQQACVRWFRYQYPQYVIAAVPNGGKRSGKAVGLLTAEGVLKGFPDLLVLLPGRAFFIEMKSSKGRVSEDQQELLGKIAGLDHAVYVCNSYEQFVQVVEREVVLHTGCQCKQAQFPEKLEPGSDPMCGKCGKRLV